MTSLDKIKINDLLLKREVEFSKVYECEQRINKILESSYPFTLPFTIPSMQKTKLKRATRKIKSKPIRQLKKEVENCYIITYNDKDIEKVEIQRDIKLIRKMLILEIPHFKIIKIETCYIDPQGQRNIIEQIL